MGRAPLIFGDELPVSIRGKEGVAIACLIADDGERIVGWVYLWNTADLGIRWVSRNREASFIEPPISDELLVTAAATDSSEIVQYLKAMQPKPFTDEE